MWTQIWTQHRLIRLANLLSSFTVGYRTGFYANFIHISEWVSSLAYLQKTNKKQKQKTHIYHQAGDDDDEYSEEEDDSIKAFSAPHVVPLLALKDVFLQRKRNLKSSLWSSVQDLLYDLLTVCVRLWRWEADLKTFSPSWSNISQQACICQLVLPENIWFQKISTKLLKLFVQNMWTQFLFFTVILQP